PDRRAPHSRHTLSAEPHIPLFYDPAVFEGVMVLSFALPYELPLPPGLNPIQIDDEYLRVRGVSQAEFDNAWMQVPFTCLTWWFVESVEPNPVVADALLATRVLTAVTGQERPPERGDTANEHKRSVVLVMVPVKSRKAAFTPPHDNKLDSLTLAH